MTWPWGAAQVFLHAHTEGEECNSQCIEVPQVAQLDKPE